jgi:hypothetical protein
MMLRRRERRKGLLVWPVCPWKWAKLSGKAPGWRIWNVTVEAHHERD